jgi:exodeoxyribonuclease V alpha subunit
VDTLSGAVERITFYNSENGYTVLRLRPDSKMAHRFTNKSSLNSEGLATVIGNLPELSPGEHLALQGQWDNHPKHGPQFKAEVCEQTLPATVAGIEGYLGSGMIKGIGPRFAERIVGRFKEETFTVIETTPQLLLEVPGIGVERMQKITHACDEKTKTADILCTAALKTITAYVPRAGTIKARLNIK